MERANGKVMRLFSKKFEKTALEQPPTHPHTLLSGDGERENMKKTRGASEVDVVWQRKQPRAGSG